MPAHAPTRRPADVVAAVISDLEHAVGDGGALNPVVPARRRLWGGLHEGCTVVSRGPWMLQRGLTAMVMTAPARIVMGQVDRRIDDDDDASFGQHHRPVVGRGRRPQGRVVGVASAGADVSSPRASRAALCLRCDDRLRRYPTSLSVQ